MDVPHCVINDYNSDTCKGVLKFLNKEIPSTFLTYEDERAALRMYEFLIRHANDDDLLRCHQIACHEKKCLLAFEDCLNIMEFFEEQKSDWKRRCSKRSRASWFSYIRKDFVKIFQDAARIWARKAGKSRCKSIYTENPIKCLFVTMNGSQCRVKVLPNLDGPRSKMNDDIEELKNLMDVIINYPFGSDKPDYDRFNLSPELRCFLRCLKSEFLDYISPRCLLDSPFIWGDADKCRFLINLDYLLKRRAIDLNNFNYSLDESSDGNLSNWIDALYNKPVLYKVYDYSRNSYKLLTAAAVVRFCSNVFRHYNQYADECGERKIGKIRIVRKLSEALPNLFVDLFDGCINHAYCLGDLYESDAQATETSFSQTFGF
ncbi:hypothetical protein ERO13_D06G025800v2 [Gossypium hirsutum]|nr:hypothetical protein ERO13_D06G025800v2 [Gossypium hirsutum]